MEKTEIRVSGHQDMFINYYYLFLCGLCASVAMSTVEKTKPICAGHNGRNFLCKRRL